MKRSALLLALSMSLVSPLLAGPPWITIELKPAGDQVAWARTFHHGTPMALPLAGTAEGLVNGQRRTVALRFDSTGESNAFAIPRVWGDQGVWVLNMGITQGEHGTAGAVIGIDRSGVAVFVRYPRNYQGMSRMATRGEVAGMLEALDQGRQPPTLTGAGVLGTLRLGGPVLVLSLIAWLVIRGGAFVVRRVRSA